MINKKRTKRNSRSQTILDYDDVIILDSIKAHYKKEIPLADLRDGEIGLSNKGLVLHLKRLTKLGIIKTIRGKGKNYKSKYVSFTGRGLDFFNKLKFLTDNMIFNN